MRQKRSHFTYCRCTEAIVVATLKRILPCVCYSKSRNTGDRVLLQGSIGRPSLETLLMFSSKITTIDCLAFSTPKVATILLFLSPLSNDLGELGEGGLGPMVLSLWVSTHLGVTYQISCIDIYITIHSSSISTVMK